MPADLDPGSRRWRGSPGMTSQREDAHSAPPAGPQWPAQAPILNVPRLLLARPGIDRTAPASPDQAPRQKKLRALFRAAPPRKMPTIAQSGLPGFEVIGWNGFVGPAGTPASIIAKLNAAMRRALDDAQAAAPPCTVRGSRRHAPDACTGGQAGNIPCPGVSTFFGS